MLKKLIPVFIALFIFGALFAAPVQVTFKDTNAALVTRNLILQENTAYPTGTGIPVNQQWIVQSYVSYDDVIDLLDANANTTGDDVMITGQTNSSFGLKFLNNGYWGSSATTYNEAGGAGTAFQGDKVYVRIFNSTSIATATKYIVFTALYTVGTTTPQSIQCTPTYAWSPWITIAPVADQILTITSTPTGQPVWVNGAPAEPALVTPAEITNPTEGAIYTIANPLYTWAPVSYTVPADFETATVDFVGTEIDTYLYKVNVNGPDGYAVTHLLHSGTTDYVAQANNEAELLGMYEIAAAPEGWHWAVNPIEVVAGGWTQTSPAGKATPGTRSNGAKVAYVLEKTIEFVLVENPPEYDVPADTPTPVGDVTITATGNLDLVVVAPDAPALALLPNLTAPGETQIIGLTGTGTVDLTFAVGVGTWYGMLYVGGVWYEGVPFPLTPGPGNITFTGVNFDAKGEVVFVAKEGSDPTLPVVLSSFTAVLTAQNYVQLNWITESETNMLGFRVYRSETSELSDAVLITPIMIGATNTSSTQHYSVTDNEVVVGTTYNYWLESVDMGPSTFHGPQTVTVEGPTTPTLPAVTQLGNAYPNPFRASTNINLAVKEGETATVTIYNILGQVVRTYNKTQGSHTINWDGRDARGNACGSGIYFYKLSSPSMNQTKKMVIVK